MLATPPRHCSGWGHWVPSRDTSTLSAFELGFASTIDQRSHLLKKDQTPFTAYQNNQCDTSHMRRCLACGVQQLAKQQAHEHTNAKDLFAHGVLTMIDDRPLSNWTGVRRFVRAPQKVETHGLAGLDAYCHAYHDGKIFVMLFSRKHKVWASSDGLNWTAVNGQIQSHTDHGFDFCVSRLTRGRESYFAGAGIGATPCWVRQPRLFEVSEPSGGTSPLGPMWRLTASPLFFGANATPDYRHPASVKCPNGQRWQGRKFERLRSNHSLLAAGGDTCTQFFHNGARGTDVLSTRLNICTMDPNGNPRPREIRGLELREVPDLRATKVETRPADEVWAVKLRMYLDLQGKADRYRFQLYGFLAGRYPSEATDEEQPRKRPLMLGLANVLNYPKADAVPLFQQNCSLLRAGLPLCDTMDVYLANSRDGIHFDWDWIYARQPLIPRGPAPTDHDHKMVFPCGQPISHDGYLWLFYVGYAVGHEQRSQGKPSASRVARWPLHTMVGLQPDGDQQGELWTKLFALDETTWVLSFLIETCRTSAGRGPSVELGLFSDSQRLIHTASFEISAQAPRSRPCVLQMNYTQVQVQAQTAQQRVALRIRLENVSLYAISPGPLESLGRRVTHCNVRNR